MLSPNRAAEGAIVARLGTLVWQWLIALFCVGLVGMLIIVALVRDRLKDE